MNIFLDTLSPKNVLILFDNQRNILNKYFFDVRLNESTLLIWEFDNFLKQNNISFFDLENIVFVNWPWSFTWIRTVVLFVNTINFVIKKKITTLNYFELFDKYPIIKTSSKRDSFVKFSKNEDIEVLQNDIILKKITQNWILNIFWDFTFDKINTFSDVNYENLIKNIIFQNQTISQAVYLKKPSIT